VGFTGLIVSHESESEFEQEQLTHFEQESLDEQELFELVAHFEHVLDELEESRRSFFSFFILSLFSEESLLNEYEDLDDS